ncbi:phage recombination protein Bet [Streptococcus dysgalactiae]|uniref:phage recombination protein Bet n=1 Tax=Streptococcus dysgalactiae TaxID=1334 RepID=UPI003983C6FD
MTNNQIVEAKGDFLTNPQLLNSGIIRKYLDPQGKASDDELAYFIAQAKTQNLNPFTKEIYFIKHGNQPAQVVTAKSAFEKKADAHPQFDGKEAGVIYLQDGEIKYSKGAFIPKGTEILGGWAKVYRKDRTYPTETEVSFEECDNSKIRARIKELTQQGKDITYPVMNSYGKAIGENNWDTMPCVMIRKVALVSAYREAFPAELGSSYEADEIQLDNIPKNVTPQETQEEVRARKMAQIEQMKQEQAQKQAEKADTSYPADEVPDYTDEPMQGELLDGELEY